MGVSSKVSRSSSSPLKSRYSSSSRNSNSNQNSSIPGSKPGSKPDSIKNSANGSLTRISQISSLNHSLNKLPPLGSDLVLEATTDFGVDGDNTRTILDTVNGRTSINGLDFNILIVDQKTKRKSKSFGAADRKPRYASEFRKTKYINTR